ncbi:MAG: LptF/LptG family permease [Chlamydiales bacterium]
MPIFGLYLLKNYLKVLFLSLFSFIAILLVSRLEEIAQLASMGAKISYIALFALYQISYLMPVAISISCVISAILLFQRLSRTHELTALRSSGVSLYLIISPVLMAGAVLALINFYFTSEIATVSHLESRKKVYNLVSVNPLLLLQNAKIANLQGAYIQMDPIRNGKEVKDLLIVLNNRPNKRLNLCLAGKVVTHGEKLQAEQVSFISSLPSAQKEDFDPLIIENQQMLSTSATELASIIGKKGWKITNDHLKFSLLRVRQNVLKKEIAIEKDPVKKRKLKRYLKKSYTEIARRVSLGLAAFTFTLMGTACGMEISRNHTNRGVISVLILASLSLVSFFMGKEFDHLFWIANLFFLLPHLLITLFSTWTLRRVNKGIE